MHERQRERAGGSEIEHGGDQGEYGDGHRLSVAYRPGGENHSHFNN
jgi:hypothetical protein